MKKKDLGLKGIEIPDSLNETLSKVDQGFKA
jgi:hypothetical protein